VEDRLLGGPALGFVGRMETDKERKVHRDINGRFADIVFGTIRRATISRPLNCRRI
jgi:hypothetical protein